MSREIRFTHPVKEDIVVTVDWLRRFVAAKQENDMETYEKLKQEWLECYGETRGELQ